MLLYLFCWFRVFNIIFIFVCVYCTCWFGLEVQLRLVLHCFVVWFCLVVVYSCYVVYVSCCSLRCVVYFKNIYLVLYVFVARYCCLRRLFRFALCCMSCYNCWRLLLFVERVFVLYVPSLNKLRYLSTLYLL